MRLTLADLDLALRRPMTALWIGAALLFGAVLWQRYAVMPLHVELAERQAEHARTTHTRTVPAGKVDAPKSLQGERLEAFLSMLGAGGETEKFVGIVFDEAQRRGLTLAQAEYKLDHDKTSQFQTYQMTLPVRGSYPQLRALVDAVLDAIPCAALEDLDFKREAIGATQTEARLRFVFFLREAES